MTKLNFFKKIITTLIIISILLGLTGCGKKQDEEELKKVSSTAYKFAINNLNQEEFKVFKPMPSPIDKIQNKYRWRIIIKGNMDKKANEELK